MADCTDILKKFDAAISLNSTDRKYLRSARSAITKKILSYFSEYPQCPKIEFKGQGSFSMGTIIKPLQGDYDIDIGIYLRDLSNYCDDWPKPETVSQWLLRALSNHTSTPVENKRTCVRIYYKPISANKDIAYHVDLPIYVEYVNFWDNKKTKIGLNGDNQWSKKSAPVKFTKWFNEKCQRNNLDKNQLVRLVKYIKAWKDFKKNGSRFPHGMALTVLLANSYYPDKRDDIAFTETIRRAYNSLYWFFGMAEIHSPVEPYNDLLIRLTPKQKKYFKMCFEQLVDDAKMAISIQDKCNAFQKWENNFGNRMKL
jgi:hypothetical protein